MIVDRRFEKMRRRAQHLLLEQPRGQRRGAAGEHRAAARIGAGAVRDGGAVALQDLDVLDAGAELVGDHLRQRRLQALAVRGDAEAAVTAPVESRRIVAGLGAGVDRHARRRRDARADAGQFGIAGDADAEEPAFGSRAFGLLARRSRRSRSPRRRAVRLSRKPERSHTMPEATL